MAVDRKSNHYQKNIWAHEFLESLPVEKNYTGRVKRLKEEFSDVLLDDMVGSFAKLELIDAMERLGVGYHFEKEIKTTLDILWSRDSECVNLEDLHSVALYFRVLRKHGYRVSQDVLYRFQDHRGNFRAGLATDVKGMLSLYEASYLGLEGENILNEANAFTTKHLPLLSQQTVIHALELPMYWRMPRLESRWYIDASQSIEKIDASLLQLSQLDFNVVQSIHQKELCNLSSWWRQLDLARNLSFARDRLVESFLWSIGLAYEPQHQRCREWLTKVITFILIIDDIYDIYGSLEELELFTTAIQRWDNDAIEQLPEYMKICYRALYNTINDMANTIYIEESLDILPHFKKVWLDFCEAMLLEAKWSNNKYTPSLNEYLANAWISSSTPVGLVHAFFATKQKITSNLLDCLYSNCDPIRSSALIFRLCNDLAISSAELQRGDVASAIQCYMRETNTSEEVARKKINHLIREMWKTLNESMYDSPFDCSFVIIAMNHVRNGHSFYQHGDGISVQDHEAKERVKALLIKSI